MGCRICTKEPTEELTLEVMFDKPKGVLLCHSCTMKVLQYGLNICPLLVHSNIDGIINTLMRGHRGKTRNDTGRVSKTRKP